MSGTCVVCGGGGARYRVVIESASASPSNLTQHVAWLCPHHQRTLCLNLADLAEDVKRRAE